MKEKPNEKNEAPEPQWEDSWRPEDKAQEAAEQDEERKKHPDEEPEVRRNEKFIGPESI